MTVKTARPKPPPPRIEAAVSVMIVTRLSLKSRERIKALATTEGLTMQQLGAYAWSLALEAYGQAPLPEAKA